MTSIRQSGWAALLVLCAATASAQTTRPSKQYTIDQFLNTTSISGASFSADESRILFSSNKTGIWNVLFDSGDRRRVDADHQVDDRFDLRRLLFPKDDRILFTRDQGGNELNHLYVLKDGQERDLTPGEKLKAQFAGWTPDGGAFFVASNERDPRYFDIYRYDAGTYSEHSSTRTSTATFRTTSRATASGWR